MIVLLTIVLLIAFLGSIVGTLWAIALARDGWAIAGVFAMVLIALQLGGAAGLLLG